MSAKEVPYPYRFGWFDWFCLWYPPGWLILFNRHWQHYKPDPDGWNWLEYLLFLLPGGFYLALLIRWLRLGGRSPRANPTPPDPDYQQRFRAEVLAAIVQRHFRAELHGLENLPEKSPVIMAMNHAGMCFPWDFVSVGLLLSQKRDWFVQPLAHSIFFDHPWLRWWLPSGWSQVLGGVRADADSFEAAIEAGAVLLYAPEGWRGLAKGWRQRYQLATFDPSFVRLSIRHRVPVLPVVCLGSEFLHPFTVNIKRLARWLGMPLFPISPLVLVFVLFPSMGVWASWTRLRYSLQPLWHPWEDELEPSRSETYQLAEKLRSRLQTLIDDLRSKTR
nr:1-acyl-sn-glycerol-3-phosphate acyltransferase [Leptolyngbya sp. FACHB-36]